MNALDTKRGDVRKLAKSVIDDFGFSWAKFGQTINNAIANSTFVFLNRLGGGGDPTAIGKAWQVILGDTSTTNWNNIDKWTELEEVLNEIINSRKDPTSNNLKVTKSNPTNSTPQRSEQIFTGNYVFGLLKYQDTILPLFFLDTYKRRFPNMEFETFDTWEEITQEMLAGRVHFTIHNLHTVASFNLSNPCNTLAYLPIFTFHGYQIFLKVSIGNNSFRQMKPVQRRELLEKLKVIVEKGNDFEWIWIEFCQIFGCDLNKIRVNIIYENVNIAKKRFIEEEDLSIYCTNSIHAKELQKQPDLYESIGYGEQLTEPEHKNSNGIACPVSFCDKNIEVAKVMQQVWFDIMKTTFIPAIQKAMRSINLKQQPKNVILIKAIMNELNEVTGANINEIDFYEMFHTSNSFHENLQTAKNGFLHQCVDTKIMKNYKEIIRLQTQNQFPDNKIDVTINNIIKQVSAL